MIAWVVKAWSHPDSQLLDASPKVHAIDAFGAAVSDWTAELKREQEVGMMTAHRADTDFLIALAEIHPSAAGEAQPLYVHTREDADAVVPVRVRRWQLHARDALPAQADVNAAGIVASEVAEAFAEEGAREERFITVHWPSSGEVANVGWYEPASPAP